MTYKELEQVIERKEVPKDRLSDSWGLLAGMSPVTIIFIGAVINLLKPDNPISTSIELLLFAISGLLFGIAMYFFINDRKLKSIVTGQRLGENRRLVLETMGRLTWKYEVDNAGVFRVQIPFLFGKPGHLLIIICAESEILFNIRNIGTSRGRAPFLFGIDTAREMKFRRELTKAMQRSAFSTPV